MAYRQYKYQRGRERKPFSYFTISFGSHIIIIIIISSSSSSSSSSSRRSSIMVLAARCVYQMACKYSLL